MADTLTTTLNYSGMLYAKTDEKTRFLDAIYARGANQGRSTTNSVEFVLSSSYELDPPAQPNISEHASLTAPAPTTIDRDQESNVTQIYQETVNVSYMKLSNQEALAGVNLANAVNNVPDEFDNQVSKRVAQIRLNLNYTCINGVYQYTPGSTTIAPRSRGIINGIVTNKFDAAGAVLTKNMVNNAIKDSIANGLDPAGLEIWISPNMMDVITDTYVLIPGSTLPASRTVGGVAYSAIMTNYGELPIMWDPMFPDKKITFVHMGLMSIAEKPHPVKGVLFVEELAKVGAGEGAQVYGELGLNYAAEWYHAVLENLA